MNKEELIQEDLKYIWRPFTQMKSLENELNQPIVIKKGKGIYLEDVDGNKYTFQLNACNNPQKDGKNALNHVTNDFITLTEVQEGVAGALGAAGNLLKVESCDVDFTSIVVTAVIDGGNLKSVQISYSMNVKALNLKATLIPITGKGAGDMICTYSNFS